MKVLYVINVFPTEAETSVINEINALDGLGLPLQLYYMRNGPPDGYGNQVKTFAWSPLVPNGQA